MDVRAIWQFFDGFIIEKTSNLGILIRSVKLSQVSVGIGVNDSVHIGHVVIFFEGFDTSFGQR